MPPPQPLWYKEILNSLVKSSHRPGTVLAVNRVLEDQRIREGGSYWMLLVPIRIHVCYVGKYSVFICI